MQILPSIPGCAQDCAICEHDDLDEFARRSSDVTRRALMWLAGSSIPDTNWSDVKHSCRIWTART